MKSILKNRKGFTLIELLAVIVILAILVMVAIPAVTRYLNYSRQGTFVDNAKSAISAVRNDVIISGGNKESYPLTEINKLLEKKLITSPFGGKYCTQSNISIEYGEDGSATYSIILYDEDGRGWSEDAIPENQLDENDVNITVVTPTTCIPINDSGTAAQT